MLPIAAAIGGVLIQVTASVVGRAIVALGFALVTYKGVDVTLGWLKGEAVSWLTQLPPNMLGMMALMKVGVCLNIIFSAVVARLTLNGFQSGTFKRWVTR